MILETEELQQQRSFFLIHFCFQEGDSLKESPKMMHLKAEQTAQATVAKMAEQAKKRRSPMGLFIRVTRRQDNTHIV